MTGPSTDGAEWLHHVGQAPISTAVGRAAGIATDSPLDRGSGSVGQGPLREHFKHAHVGAATSPARTVVVVAHESMVDLEADKTRPSRSGILLVAGRPLVGANSPGLRGNCQGEAEPAPPPWCARRPFDLRRRLFA